MSERGDALKYAAGKAVGAYYENDGIASDVIDDFHILARSICEHLGITWEDVAMLRAIAEKFDTGADNHEVTGPLAVWTERKADALATLLEAAGIER